MILKMSIETALKYIILGIKNKNYQAAVNLTQDCINQIEYNAKNSVQKPNEEKRSNWFYIVTKEGFSRHEMLGIFNTKKLATEVAKRAKLNESDDYHNFDVLELELNQEVEDGFIIYSTDKTRED